MTIQIPREVATDEFISRVEAYCHAMVAHQSTVDTPAPMEHPLVEACVKRVRNGDDPDTFIIDYQIIEPTLEKQKHDLLDRVHTMTKDALAKVMLPGKRKVLAIQASELKAKSDLTDEDKIVLAKHNLLEKHGYAVTKHAAKLHAQIEDLTEETVKLWSPEPFPEI